MQHGHVTMRYSMVTLPVTGSVEYRGGIITCKIHHFQYEIHPLWWTKNGKSIVLVKDPSLTVRIHHCWHKIIHCEVVSPSKCQERPLTTA